jgi:hypothetical protein
MTPEQIQQARELRANGASWRSITDRFGVGYHALRKALDPAWAEDVKIRKAEWYRCSISPDHRFRDYRPVVPEHVLAERERAVNAPRTVTATLMGDPPFERSALARR